MDDELQRIFALLLIIKTLIMKNLFSIIGLLFLATSCGSLTSNTTIKPANSFVLGNNEHGTFKVKVKNVSKNDLKIYRQPLTGGSHSSFILKPDEISTVKVEKNTALVFSNQSKDTANVDLKVTGDIGFSMTYKK